MRSPPTRRSLATRAWAGRACLLCAWLLVGACTGTPTEPPAVAPTDAAVQATEAALPTADPTRISGPPPPTGLQAGQPFEGRVWRLAELGEEAARPLPGTEPTLQLLAGGISGSAGCNTFGGRYELAKDRITIGQLAASRMLCAAPEGVMEQESRYLGALQDAVAYRLEAGELILRDAEGRLVARFRDGAER